MDNELEAKSNNQVLFEVNRCLNPADLDLLSLYLENKKQSSGGDILSMDESLDKHPKALRIVYEDNQVKQRVLARKFFKFKGYMLRSSENGYKANDLYELDKNRLIIRNIEDEEDEFVIKMYAEHLLPDNNVLGIVRSKLAKANAVCVQFQDDIDLELLQKRYNKKPHLRNKKIELMNVYKTNTVLIGPVGSQHLNASAIRDAFNEAISNVEPEKPFMFLDEYANVLICQLEDGHAFSDLNLDGVLKENNLVSEYCYNFDLIELNLNMNDFPTNNPLLKTGYGKYVDRGVQTDMLTTDTKPSQIESKSLSESVSISQHSVVQSINSLAQKYSNLKQLSDLKTSEPLDCNTENVLSLDPNIYFTIALLNSKQIFLNFEEFLKTKYGYLSLKIAGADSSQLLIVKNDKVNEPDMQDWKTKIVAELISFFSTKALYKHLPIPAEILKSSALLEKLDSSLKELNKQCIAVYFCLGGDQIHCYGTKKALTKKLEHLPELLKSISDPQIIQSSKVISSQPVFFVEISNKRLIAAVLPYCKEIFNDFQIKLLNLNGELVEQASNQNSSYKIQYLQSNPDQIKWTESITNLLDEFEKKQLMQKKIMIPVHLRRPKVIDELLKHLNLFFKLPLQNLHYKMNADSVQAVGYSSFIKLFVENINSKLNSLDNGMKERIRKCLDVKLELGKMPLLAVLSHSNGFFLKEFSNQLARLEATVDLLNTKLTKLSIRCTMGKHKLLNEQAVSLWRKNVDTFLGSYFGKFKIQRVPVQLKQTEIDELGLSEHVNVVWIDQTTIELSGLITEVDLAIGRLNQKPLPIRNANQMGAVGIKPVVAASAEETFLISDLKWFQTRMLFEKKYFQFLTETFKDLAVMVDTNLSRIFYTGRKKDIDDAKKLAFDILDQILGAEVEATQGTLLKMVDNENSLAALLKQRGICCIIDTKQNAHKNKSSYAIYATSYQEIEQCKLILAEVNF